MAVEIVSIVDEGLGHSAYLVAAGGDDGTDSVGMAHGAQRGEGTDGACTVDGDALVIDPLRTVGRYREVAASRGWRIRRTADTHLHADHVSGGPELGREGIEYLAPGAAGVEVPHRRLADGDELHIGRGVRLQALATPGHTPDHLAYVVYEGERPVAVLTGGSLMVGTVGRPDLIGDAERTELARAMWHTLHEKLLTLPDDVVVYPTHGAGSFCAAPGSSDRVTTIGRERATNPLLSWPDEDSFVAALLGGQGSVPAHFRWLPDLNRRGPAAAPPAHLSPLDPDAVQRLLDRGAQVVDVRPVEAFAAGHIPGSLSNPLRPAFAAWLGWLGDPSRSLVFVADGTTDRAELLRQCAVVGFDRIAGELAGGLQVWSSTGRSVATADLVDPGDVDADTRVPGPLLDVRQDHEFHAGHLPGAVHVALGDVPRTRLPAHARWTVMCGHGERATTAASLLARAGHPLPRIVVGGPDDWAAATGRALVTGP